MFTKSKDFFGTYRPYCHEPGGFECEPFSSLFSSQTQKQAGIKCQANKAIQNEIEILKTRNVKGCTNVLAELWPVGGSWIGSGFRCDFYQSLKQVINTFLECFAK